MMASNMLLNATFLLAAVLFVIVVYVQTSRIPPPEQVRAGWPLRRFWVSHRMRHLGLALMVISAVAGIAVALATGVQREELAARELLFACGCGLAGLGAAMLCYSILLYWQPSPPKPHGF